MTKEQDKKINYIIREIPPEQTEFSCYFDSDGLTAAGGDYCYNLFIVPLSRNSCGFNKEEYVRIVEQADAIIDGFYDVNNKWTNGYDSFETYKEAMEYNHVPYTSRKCHSLKDWAKNADANKPEDIAKFLTITTGKEWETESALGYSQGDYVKIVYCPEFYKSGVKQYGEIWLGAGKEFSITFLNEPGEEDYTVYGYIVADSQARTDEDYKRLVCEWAGIPEEDARLEMIDGHTTITQYTYRTA